ncbi:MAG: MFS transporter [Alphaproteobacteria bacterium]|nr:MFS transporter [Alphaproteobacteria bacterium]
MNISSLLGGIGPALANPVYRMWWMSNGISTIGRWIYRTAVLWLTWRLTEDTTWLGIMAFADVFPMVVLSVFSGAISDRIGYIRVIKAMQLCYIGVGAAFAALLYFDAMTIYLCLGLTVCHGITEAMSTPPRLALVNALVGRDELSAAVALNSATFNGCRLIGPGIGGALLVLVKEGVIGADLVFGIATLAFIQLYVVVFFLPAKGAGGEGKVSLELLRDMADGAAYVWRNPGIRFLMFVLGMTGLFIRPFMELASGYADLIFGLPEEALGTILSTIGGGAMLSCLWLARRGRTEGLTRLCTHSFALLALVLLIFTQIDNLFLAIVPLFLIGFLMLVTGTAAQSLIQNAAGADMRARAVSFFILLNWGMPAFGALLAGWVASFAGIQPTIAGGAIIALVFWLWAHRQGRLYVEQLETEKNPDEKEAARC